MERNEFRRFFGKTSQVVLPVIHVFSEEQTLTNIEILMAAGADGCWLINHHFEPSQLVPTIRAVRDRFPSLWLGVNFLGLHPLLAFKQLSLLESTGTWVDGYWADDAEINVTSIDQPKAAAIASAKSAAGWDGLFFGGVAFKYRSPVPASQYESVANLARPFMDVVTTSGAATGEAAEKSKITSFRKGGGNTAIALASGVTPENAHEYRDADCFIVATGINKADDFFNIDASRLAALLSIASKSEIVDLR